MSELRLIVWNTLGLFVPSLLSNLDYSVLASNQSPNIISNYFKHFPMVIDKTISIGLGWTSLETVDWWLIIYQLNF